MTTPGIEIHTYIPPHLAVRATKEHSSTAITLFKSEYKLFGGNIHLARNEQLVLNTIRPMIYLTTTYLFQ